MGRASLRAPLKDKRGTEARVPKIKNCLALSIRRGGRALRGFRVLALLDLGRSFVVGGLARRHRRFIERHSAPQRRAKCRDFALQPRIVLCLLYTSDAADDL